MNRPLFIFELANNHNGSVPHGLKIIRAVKAVTAGFPEFDFAFKFQYRQLDSFIHPAWRERTDVKYIKRFSGTRLSRKDLDVLLGEVKKLGFRTVCTAFDEASVPVILEQGFEIIKVASASFTDWTLIEAAAASGLEMILSTAGASTRRIVDVTDYLRNRNRVFSLMHCVAEYPTPPERQELNQIDYLKRLCVGIRIGYSTHERPDNFDSVGLAVAEGAEIFEKHVDVEDGGFKVNAYSAVPAQIKLWLEAARKAFVLCGGDRAGRYEPSAGEADSLKALSRGVFAARDMSAGEFLLKDCFYLAMPNFDGQLCARDLSKYSTFKLKAPLEKDGAVYKSDLDIKDYHDTVKCIVTKIHDFLLISKVTVPNKSAFELSHHYGLDRFTEVGAGIINCINREYCKKLIILLPGQRHPVHYHKKKEETFHILYGELLLVKDEETRFYSKGDMVLIERGQKHGFSTETGVVFEEISTTDFKDDSFYEDEEIMRNKLRKTSLIYNN